MRRGRGGMGNARRGIWIAATILTGTATLAPAMAAGTKAQSGPKVQIGKPTSAADPVTYLTDHESYDQKNGIATWWGNVQVWQGDHALRADRITYDRNTGVMAARGHVAIVEPDGSTTYASYVELSNGMHDGIATGIYLRMEDNAKLAANGMRRTGGQINEMTHAVYTACKPCAANPAAPAFWQLRAYGATQDVEHKRIEFTHAWMDILGIPVIYFPTFSMSDPTVKRQSGFLTTGISPHDRWLGTYMTIPYFWAIDDQQDLTVQGLISSRTGPQISGLYRNAMNFGKISAIAGVAYDTHRTSSFVNAFGNDVGSTSEHGIQGYVRGMAEFDINRWWRAGVNVNLASSANYMRDYRISGYGNEFLNSTAYLEGFGVGAYARLDGSFFQGLNQGVIHDAELPYVLPRLTYAFQGKPDAWGGTFSLHTTDFDLYRASGVSDQRGEVQMNWDRPFRNTLGQIWLLTLRVDSMLYRGNDLYQQPAWYGTGRNHTAGQVLPTIALKLNWPFLRGFAHGHGTQVFEPVAQIIAAPNSGNSATRFLPNEDSLSYEFTDTTLFSLNRWQGTDRLDGGLRANFGLHNNWSWRGHAIDVLIGESVQEHIQHNRVPYSGLDHTLSDPVGRIRFSPSKFIDLTARGRYNPWRKAFDYGEGLISTGVPIFHINAGYVYEPVTPYYYYATNYRQNGPTSAWYTPMSEISGGFSSQWRNYHLSVFGRRSLARHQFVSLGGDIGYANDCFGLDILAIKQYTSIGGQQRNTTVLFNFTFKTIGTFGING